VFDWDDTLLASSYILDSPVADAIDTTGLDKLVVDIMNKALSLSTAVYIITNATINWVEQSAQQYLPNVVPLLKQVTILSARTLYESKFPSEPIVWKCETFKQHITPSRHIISLGDSEFERKAVHDFCATLPETFCKSIKFQVYPTCQELVTQLGYVTINLEQIIKFEGHLDLQIKI
jgi:hypothetical protein